MERAILEAIERKAKQHGIARFKVELGWAENLDYVYRVWIKFQKRPNAKAQAITKYISLEDVWLVQSVIIGYLEELLDDIWKEEEQSEL